jgi:hypothetical protein
MALTSENHRKQIRNGFRLEGNLLLGFLTILFASALAVAQASSQESDRLETDTQRSVTNLNAKLKVNQPTSCDAELQAQCRVNCSDAMLRGALKAEQ